MSLQLFLEHRSRVDEQCRCSDEGEILEPKLLALADLIKIKSDVPLFNIRHRGVSNPKIISQIPKAIQSADLLEIIMRFFIEMYFISVTRQFHATSRHLPC